MSYSHSSGNLDDGLPLRHGRDQHNCDSCKITDMTSVGCLIAVIDIMQADFDSVLMSGHDTNGIK